ncbi:MAG: cell division protein FtsZ [Zoogloeaceae bacterium]|nr:cell division protein FtsZ [Zoogloeaceae bacterium]
MLEIFEKVPAGTIIKVIGVGGAGGNAVDHMIRAGVQGVDFVCANTDAQALARNLAQAKVQLGNSGLGAGSKPEAGRAAAQDSREQIAAALEGAHMAFITGGMGGGTGTGAAPVIAEIAKEMGILSVGVVTKPFEFENRGRVAESGVEELAKNVDSLIVVLNDKLLDVYGDDASFEECFRSADDVLKNAVGGIAEIINVPGLVNVDFQDVRTAMGEMGRAMMGSAEAAGIDRARIAAEQAAVSPLLEGTELSGARCVLINITASRSLKMSEVRDAVKTVQAFAAQEAFVKYGTVFEEEMGDRMRVTVVATGLGAPRVAVAKPVMQVLQGTGTFGPATGGIDVTNLDVPAVMRSGRRTAVEAMSSSGMSTYDIPAFLRKQAD